MKVETTVQAYTVDYQCDECKKGKMRWLGMTLTVNPPLYPHRCDNCGAEMESHEVYPHVEHR